MKTEIKKANTTSFIDATSNSNLKYQCNLLTNDDEKIVTVLRKYLQDCDEFIFSVAFITLGGLTLFLEEFKNLERRNIRGKILTGDYLNFTEPQALKKILTYKNLDLKIANNKKFHPKAYLFRKASVWTLIVGSSNLTQGALTVNFEWNLKVTSLDNGNIILSTLQKFNEAFNSATKISSESIERYKNFYNLMREKQASLPSYAENISDEIKPNSMQKEALKSLKNLSLEENKALLISATGTGKTYLSAFAVKDFEAKKILFVAHRKVILEKSMSSFKKIIKDREMCIFDRNFNLKNIEKIVIFTMVQTLSKNEYLNLFPKDYFDYIIIDEVHHSVAKTYQNILNYFEPKFLLGLTATPERSDNFNIYSFFDYNIAYEIRLHQAMEEELLCPFHYFGISDITIDGETISDKTAINKLTSTKRVEYILAKSDYYGFSGDKLHALVFVSNIEEAKILSDKFNSLGRSSISLSSENSDIERELAIKNLEKGKLEFIFTVDIFNEGIDIPCVNQVLFLRPTSSSIVYIQQLGRGLRKNSNKNFTVILDFIGNYDKNFLIPIAISQNSNYDKDSMKRFLMNATNTLPGESSINFDEISKEKIFENINKTNFSNKKLIEHDFDLLEKKLGRLPMLVDFFENNLLDPTIILKYKKDYDNILKLLRPNLNIGNLNSLEKKFLIFLSSFFVPAKRIHETFILKKFLVGIKNKNDILSVKDMLNNLEKEYCLEEQEINVVNALKHLSKEIFKNLSQMKPYPNILEKVDENYRLSLEFKNSYEKNSYFKMLLNDLLDYNLKFYKKYYSKNRKKDGYNSLTMYGEYSKQEAFWHHNLDFNNGYQVSGYTAFEKEKKLLIFITMVNSNTRNIYTNTFFTADSFNWFSKPNRYLKKGKKDTIEGKIARNYYNISVFVKKVNGENFYYLGDIEEVLSAQEIQDEQSRPIVEYTFKLRQEVKKELLTYFNY